MAAFFEQTFGFVESNYKMTQKVLLEKFVDNKINNISCGHLTITSLLNPDYVRPLSPRNGHVSLHNVYGDVREYILKYPNATFQVASQFNLLEMADPSLTPENGISIYANDQTQGPICAIMCPSALAYRNYLIPINKQYGQTSNLQIDTTVLLHNLFKQSLKVDTDFWTMKNGYLMFNNENNLRNLNSFLSTDPNLRRITRSKITIGFHDNVGVADYTKNPVKELHKIMQVLCSGLPIAYNNINKNIWKGLAEIFLEAAYENTLLVSVRKNEEMKQNNPCFLTLIGGGVFGMDHEQIKRAIVRACNIVASYGSDLDVYIIHYKNNDISNRYEQIQKIYPLDTYSSGSIWDDPQWILDSC